MVILVIEGDDQEIQNLYDELFELGYLDRRRFQNKIVDAPSLTDYSIWNEFLSQLNYLIGTRFGMISATKRLHYLLSSA